MAAITSSSVKFLHTVDSNKDWWQDIHFPSETVPVSGIYRCKVCGKEITSNKGDKFPPQNRHQHPSVGEHSIRWQLIVRTDTDGNNCGINK